MKKKAFTLIEILVVITIISLLATIGVSSYSTLSKGSFDAKRKADLEEIRSALEMYRSNNGSYPVSISAGVGLTDPSGVTYIQKIPQDPKFPTYKYDFTSITTSTYTLGTYLENPDNTSTNFGTCGDTGDCKSDAPCNYCLTPYGRK